MPVIKPITLEEEYKKHANITPEDIKSFREWLETQPHLPADAITDLDLILCYHACRRSMAVSKQVLDSNFTHKTHFVEIFKKNRVVDDVVIKTLDTMVTCCVKSRTKEDEIVIYITIRDWDTKKFIFKNLVSLQLMLLDLWQVEQGSWPGAHMIIDLKGITLGIIPRLDLATIQQTVYYVQESIFLKLAGIHFMNAPTFMDKILMLLKPFMKKELQDLINIHPIGTNTIENLIPISALPQIAGGKYKTTDEVKEYNLALFKDNADFFVQENRKRVTESLRPGKPKTISDFFGGIEGSFKKLDID